MQHSGRPEKLQVVIDWLEFEICTAEPTNFMAIQRMLANLQGLPEGAPLPYVEDLDAGQDRAASVFRFRLHDPKNHQAVVTLLEQLGERFTFQRLPIVTGLEVSFDTFRPDASACQLAEIITQRQRWTTHKPCKDWHLYRDKGGGSIYLNSINQNEFIRYLADGWQLSDRADKAVPVRAHAYVKMNNAGLALHPQQWRARFEITLKGSALPCVTLDQLKHFDFTELAHYFQFRQYADNNPCRAIAHARGWLGITQPGRRGPYRRRAAPIARYSGTREFKSWTAPDSQLNAQIYASLRKLTRSWRSSRK